MALKVATWTAVGKIKPKKQQNPNQPTKPPKSTNQSLPKLCFLSVLGLCQPCSKNRRGKGLIMMRNFHTRGSYLKLV